VMSLDISSDSTLLVTASADKNVKIWGLDFGDCHKSIFAHDDSIQQIKFLKKTHYFFTCSKDHSVKYWDADKFEHIQTLNGHFGAVWCLCISNSGGFVVSGSQDKSLRIWERIDEQLFLEEERESAMEKLFEMEEDTRKDVDLQSTPAGKRTLETIKAGEKLAETIEMCEAEKKKNELQELIAKKDLSNEELQQRKSSTQPTETNPLLLNLSPSAYLLRTLKGIRSSDLEEALYVLPFSNVIQFFDYLNEWIIEGKDIELNCRCLFFLLKSHHNQLIANKSIVKVLNSLRKNTRIQLQQFKDIVGFNHAALNYLKKNIELHTNKEFFFEQSLEQHQSKKSKTKA